MRVALIGILFVFFLLGSKISLAEKVVNVYTWGGFIPKEVIHSFEKTYHIKVNFSTYDNNETMYAKLKATRRGIYDVIMPSSYYVERMRHQDMLLALDAAKLPNLKNLSPLFVQTEFDPGNHFSVPLTWGITGIFYNSQYIQNPPKTWQDLWDPRWRHQLLMLDDAREIFSIALLSLGYNPNDTDPKHLKEAYEKLLAWVPNIKLFASESLIAIMIDEDALIGSAWNGDTNKAHEENSVLRFVYPQEGFVLWTDCLAIAKNAPHPNEAYLFINYLLSIDSGKRIAETTGYAITNAAAQASLPFAISHNPMIYPDEDILKKAYFQRDVGEKTLAIYNDYWEKLKLAF